ncbi:MAG: hypothetical protein M5U26_23080 [Planctomycetota bacterium]|nr:hypothetical protein [Planctomycetota bacterium]
MIAPLFRLGLDAVEAFHANTGEANRRFYAGLARRYDKGVTGGSDFHGPRANPARSVGCDGIGAPALADLRRRMEARKQHPIGKG